MESEIDRLRQKLENFPSPSSYTRYAELLRAQGDIGAAITACQRCIKEFPRTGQAYVILAEIDVTEGRPQEALKKLITAVERDARSYSAHSKLAEYYTTQKQIPQALSHLRQILTFKPNDPEALRRIGDLTSKNQGSVAAVAKAPTSASAPAPSPKPRPPAPPILEMKPATKTVTKTISKPVPHGLGPLIAEAGVRGALVADARGQVVSSAGFENGLDEILAALASEFSNNAVTALNTAGQGQMTQWMLSATQGQVMGFTVRQSCSVIVLAEPGVRPALLEIRAKQALSELGAS